MVKYKCCVCTTIYKKEIDAFNCCPVAGEIEEVREKAKQTSGSLE